MMEILGVSSMIEFINNMPSPGILLSKYPITIFESIKYPFPTRLFPELKIFESYDILHQKD